MFFRVSLFSCVSLQFCLALVFRHLCFFLNDVLARLLAGETDYQPLLPWNWAAAHPESIRMYRQEERRERDVRKQTQRAKRRDNKKRQSKLKRK